MVIIVVPTIATVTIVTIANKQQTKQKILYEKGLKEIMNTKIPKN